MHANGVRPSPLIALPPKQNRTTEVTFKSTAANLLSCHRWQLMFPWLPSVLQDVPLHRFNLIQSAWEKKKKQRENVTDLFIGIKSTLPKRKEDTKTDSKMASVTEKGKKSWLNFHFI